MKRKISFPPIESATTDGLVAIGGDLETDTLEEAYKRGIFPWPFSVEFPLAWFSPDPRGIIDLNEFHVSKSFKRFLHKTNFKVTYNTRFSEVIKTCAKVKRKDQGGTWITPDIILGYEKFFKEEKAYSVEVWEGDELVGGLYGVVMGDFISGESMFMKKNQASKFALFQLIQTLKSSRIKWIDTQMVTPVVHQFGGKYVSRNEFINRLSTIDWTIRRSSIFTNS